MTFVSANTAHVAETASTDRTGNGSSKGDRIWALVTLAAVGGLAGLVFWSAPAPIVAPWDVFILLDGGYRITEGQVPGTDFANPVGPLLYGLISWGMDLQQVPSLAAVAYGSLLFLALISPIAWIVARMRLPALYASAFTVFVALVVVSVRPLGYSPWTTTYAMIYNRYGWALYSVLLLLVLLRPRRSATPRALIGHGLVLGALLGLLFYCKINFFVAAVATVGVGLAPSTVPRRARLGLATGAGFAVVAITMWLVFGIRVTSYVGDLADAALAQGGTERLRMLANSIVDAAPVGVLTLGLLAALVVNARRDGRPLREVSVAVVWVLGSSVLISAANTPEQADLPALVVAPLLLVAHLVPRLPRWAGCNRLPAPGIRVSTPILTGLAVLLVVTAGPIAGKDALGLGKSVGLRGYVAEPPAGQSIAAERLQDFVVPDHAQWTTAYRTAHAVPEMINDGLALLGRHVGPDDTVFTLALTDPFSFALSLPPNRGGPLWWDLGISFDRATHPDAGRLLRDVRWVMIPRMVDGQGCCQETVTAMLDLYRPVLSREFIEAERTADWILLSRVR